jgi:hypothetical protein
MYPRFKEEYMEGKSVQASLGEVAQNGKARGIMLTCEAIAASVLQASSHPWDPALTPHGTPPSHPMA